METLIYSVFLALIPAYIAKSKGRSFVTWYIYGLLLFIIAVVHSLLLRGSMKCPRCAEHISDEAKICKHCGGAL